MCLVQRMFTQLGLHPTQQGMMTVLDYANQQIVVHCFLRFLLGVVDDNNTLYVY